jgi:hypothetical protein
MAVRKFLYVDGNADYVESIGAYETVDLNSNANGEGASLIGIEDVDSAYTGTNVEAALDEIATELGIGAVNLFDFTENNVLVDSENIFNSLDRLDLKWGDLASTANGEGASLVGVEDAGNWFATGDVESILQYLAEEVDKAQDYVTYTVGTGGVTAGDLVYVSAADTVLVYGTLTDANYGIGLARTTELAGGSVQILANDEVLPGVLTGATAGTKYYWNGTDITTTIPTTNGAHVWQVGIAKNATDLHTDIKFVKKNCP